MPFAPIDPDSPIPSPELEGQRLGSRNSIPFCSDHTMDLTDKKLPAVGQTQIAFDLVEHSFKILDDEIVLPARPLPTGDVMDDFAKLCNFQNLYKAHTVARRGKRTLSEVIQFELNLAQNLSALQKALNKQTYKLSGYYSFTIYDPKVRRIHALHYRDRVVQHCLCDEILAPHINRKLIYDNAACRIGKGTHFAINRLTGFLHSHFRAHGADGYILKCDIRKYFDSIDHHVLKSKLASTIHDPRIIDLLHRMIDSYSKSDGRGLPMGNQTSQWFALLYLDPLDRLVKEKLRIKYYTRYMDDCILISHDRNVLRQCLQALRELVETELHLTFNEKTQIFPLKNGVDYLGFHFYLTRTGKVIRKLKRSAKTRFKKQLKKMKSDYAEGVTEWPAIRQRLTSFHAHLSHGHTYHLRSKAWRDFVLIRN